MTENAKQTTASVIPTLRYEDAPAAIDWLCEAFGFERRLVVDGEAGTIRHAQLTFGNGMIMLGSERDDAIGARQRPPGAREGVGSQGICVIVEDADLHHARAVAAGARIVMELEDAHYGGRGYSCLDPEGHLWHFGTYDPWDPRADA